MIQLKKKGVVLCLSCLLLFTFLYLYSSSPPAHISLAPCLHLDNMDQLIDILNTSHRQARPGCWDSVLQQMEQLFRVELSADRVEVPGQMQQLVKQGWFKGDTVLYEKFKNPRIFIVTDRYSSQTTAVNPIRALRPKPGGSGEALAKIQQMIADSKPGCNFCNSSLTLEDSFGRVLWQKSNIFTAENAFRLYDYVGMVIPGDIHNFMDIDYETFQTMFTYTAVTWFGNLHERHRDRTHPIMIWDVMGKAGASQIHPHIQLMLGKGYYPGKMGQLDHTTSRYKAETGRDYLQDLVDVHVGLGLGFRHKSAAIIVPINPTKDYEIMIIGTEERDGLIDWSWLYYLAHRTYIEELGVFCFSQGAAIPSGSIGGGHVGAGHLMIAKLGSRGDCTSSYNDVSSLELYTINSIAADYYETMSAYVRTYEKYRATHPQSYVGTV